MDEWLITYRGYTDAELKEERERLKTQSESPFISQTQGPKSFQRAIGEIRDRLSAVTLVQGERAGAPAPDAVADFSNGAS